MELIGTHLPLKTAQVGPSRVHILALDGVRGFAAASVFVFHYGGGSKSAFLPARMLGEVVHFAWAGVSLFFVLSGFLISGILWDSYAKAGWWKRFYLRRSLRIFPLYYLALLIAIVVAIAFGRHFRDLVPLWVVALYLGNIPIFNVPAWATPAMHLEHFWSLAVEEQFYVFWPFLLFCFAGNRKNAKRLIVVLWVLSLLFRVAVLGRDHAIDWQSIFLFGRAGELLAGAYLAMLIRGELAEQEQIFRWSPVVLGVSGFALVAMVIADGSPELGLPLMATIGLSVCSVFFASLVAMALKPGWVQSFFELAGLRWLGKISYGIYVYHLLFHNGFVWLTDRIGLVLGPGLGPNGRQVLLFFVALACTLAIASLSFYTYERFFLRLKDRLSRQRA